MRRRAGKVAAPQGGARDGRDSCEHTGCLVRAANGCVLAEPAEEDAERFHEAMVQAYAGQVARGGRLDRDAALAVARWRAENGALPEAATGRRTPRLRRKAHAPPPPCRGPRCAGPGLFRGLCKTCYTRLQHLVRTHKETWASLEAAGLVLPRKGAGRKAS